MDDIKRPYAEIPVDQLPEGMPVIPPSNFAEAEQAVLGALLIDPDIAPKLFGELRPGDFCFFQNRRIFETARGLFRNGTPLDAVTICHALPKDSKIDAPRNYFAQLMEITPTSANWKEYAKIMKEQSAIMRVRAAAHELAHAKTIDECRPVIASLSDALDPQSKADVWSMNDLLLSFLNYQFPDESKPAPEYLRYGIPELDRGMYTEPGDVVVIGGYPSDGKTAWALSLGWELSQTRKVGFFSLETDLPKLRDRIITHVMRIDFSRIKQRALTDADWETIRDKENLLRLNKNYFIFHSPGVCVTDIESISRAYGFNVIFIDYVQEISAERSRYHSTRNDDVAMISRSLHSFAQKTRTTVFELSQLSRSPSGLRERDPRMDSLRDSGQLEQDADAVFLIFRKDPSPEAKDKRRILRVVKNKEGCLGSWLLDFDASTQTFSVATNTNVMHDLTAAGRAAKQRNRQAAYEQTAIPDDYDMPF